MEEAECCLGYCTGPAQGGVLFMMLVAGLSVGQQGSDGVAVRADA